MNRSYITLFLLSTATIISGCVSNSTANLDQSFDTRTSPVDANITGTSLLNDAFSDKADQYTVNMKTRVLFNTPVTSVKTNLTSNAVFNQNNSNITTTSRIGLGVTNSTPNQAAQEKNIVTTGNTSTITVRSEGNTSTRTVEAYTREETGISLEAFEDIQVQGAELLGATGESNSQLLLELEAHKSDLVANYENVMGTQAINDEDSSMQSQEGLSEFNQSKAYAWVDREERNLERYSYYGSAVDGAVQVRMDARFTTQQ